MAHALSNMLHRIVRILQNVSEQGMTGRALFRTKALRGSDVEGVVEEFPLCPPDAHLRLPSRVHKKNRTDQRLPTRIILENVRLVDAEQESGDRIARILDNRRQLSSRRNARFNETWTIRISHELSQHREPWPSRGMSDCRP
jgi:hypothetical protein